MKYIFYLLIIPLALSSCAKIFNSKTCKTNIWTSVPMTAIVDSDTIQLKEIRNNIILTQRSNKNKEIVLINDTKIDTVVMKPRLSPIYYYNICSMGYGFLIDGKTPKKWMYPSTIYLSDRWIENNSPMAIDNNKEYAHKGVLNFRLSFPYFNWFYSAYGDESKSNVGWLGISAGFDYFYNDRMYLNLSGSGIMDFIAPAPASPNYSGVMNHMYSVYASLSNNHMLFKNRFSFGYGVSYGMDQWDTVNHDPLDYDAPEGETRRESVYRKSNSLGLVIPLYYYTKKSFYMGLVYRPMLAQFSGGAARFQYQHTLSFDFGWRIRLVQ